MSTCLKQHFLYRGYGYSTPFANKRKIQNPEGRWQPAQKMPDMSENEERCQNPKPKTRKPNPNPREENGKKKRTGREKKGNGSFPILKQTRLKSVEL